MKIIVTEIQLKKIITEQNSFIDYGEKIYNKLFSKGQSKIIKPPVEKFENKPFSKENFAKYVKQIGIKHPDVAIAQAMIESGHFNSNLFKKNNNIFGMKFPRQRTTTAIGERSGQAFYKNWLDATKDYKLWQEARKLTNLSKQEYIDKLDNIYCVPPHCGNKKYSKTVMSLLGRANNLLNTIK